jgi:hypothetical protein
MHASSGIRIHDPSNQAAKTYALDGAAIGTGGLFPLPFINICTYLITTKCCVAFHEI